jgi:chromosome segregation ATPase
MVGENAGNIQGGDNITGIFFYFRLNVNINKSVEQMHANISAAEDRARVSKGEAEQAKGEAEQAKGEAEQAKGEAEQAKRNEEQAMNNAAEEKRRRLVLEAELREMKEILNARGNT